MLPKGAKSKGNSFILNMYASLGFGDNHFPGFSSFVLTVPSHSVLLIPLSLATHCLQLSPECHTL